MTEGWQPIESAPRDGTCVLLYWPDYRYEHECPPEYGGEVILIGSWKHNHRIDKDYFANTDEQDDYGLAEYRPTHWMPLPPTPTEQAPE